MPEPDDAATLTAVVLNEEEARREAQAAAEAGELLPDDRPPRGKREKGLISARSLQEEGAGKVLVSVPDGAVLVVKNEEVQAHPREISPNVSLQS